MARIRPAYLTPEKNKEVSVMELQSSERLQSTKIKNKWEGTSDEVKPTQNSQATGSSFYEIDTGEFFKYNAETKAWIKQ